MSTQSLWGVTLCQSRWFSAIHCSAVLSCRSCARDVFCCVVEAFICQQSFGNPVPCRMDAACLFCVDVVNHGTHSFSHSTIQCFDSLVAGRLLCLRGQSRSIHIPAAVSQSDVSWFGCSVCPLCLRGKSWNTYVCSDSLNMLCLGQFSFA